MRALGFFYSRFVAVMLVLVAVGCSIATPPATHTPVTLITPTVVAPTPNGTLVATRVPPTRTPIAATNALTLTLWTSEDLLAGRVLRNQLDAFTAANPNIRIDIALKKSSGKGGLLDSLQTTLAVVPTLAPDFITLDLTEVPPAIDDGNLQPLDAFLPVDLFADFFPFASRTARSRDQWLAVPFAADTQHLIYNKTLVKKPPATWDDLLKQRVPILLPLGGDEAGWLQYAALAPTSEITAPLDVNNLAQVLIFFKRARDQGLLSDAAISAKSVDETWNLFAAGQSPAAQIAASRYIIDRDKLPNAQFAAIPTRDGRIASVANGSALAMITKDPARQITTAKVMAWLMQTERLAPWLRALHRLPAMRSAVSATIDPPEYASFVRDHLERATLIPRTPVYNKISDVWRTTLANLWRGQITPEDAARSIAATK